MKDQSKTKKQLIEELEILRRQSDALRQSTRLALLLSENSCDMITRHLPDSTYLYVSPACRTMLGYEPEELIGTKAFDQMHPDDAKKIAALTQEAVRTGGYQEGQYRHLTKDGRYIWVETVGKVIKNEETGEIEDIVCIVRDINERKRADEEIRRVRREWEDIFQAIGHPTIILDTQHNIISVNRATVKAAGAVSAEELAGRKCYEIFHNSGQPPKGCPLVSMLSTGELEENDMDVEALGGVFHVSCTPVFDEKGDLQKVIHIATDITMRKRAEDALRVSSSKQEALLSAIPDIVMEVDAGKVYTWANQAGKEFFGEDVIGREAAFYFEGEQKTYEMVQPLFSGDENVVYVESWQRRKDGERRLLAWWCRVLKDKSGNVTGALSTARDITVQKMREEKIQMLSTVVEQSTEGFAIAGLEGNLIFVNEAWCRMHGYKSSRELLGRNLAIFHNQEQLENEVKPFNEKLIKYGNWNGEVGHITRDGKKFATLMVSTVLKDRQDKPYAMVGIAKDITELKKAEESLRKNEFLLKQTQQLTRVGGWEYDVARGRIAWTDEVYRIYGVSPDEFDPNNANQDIAFYEDTAAIEAAFMRAVESGEPYDLELRFRNAQGQRLWVRTIGKADIRDGRVVRVFGNFMDITERKKAEESLRESEELFRKLFENHSAVKVIIDPENGNIIDANEAAESYYGWSREQLKGMRIQDINTLPPEEIKKEMEKARDKKPIHFEFRHRRADGSIRDVEVFSSRIEVKEKIFLHSIIHDITDRKQAEEEIKRLNAELEQRVKERTAELEAANNEMEAFSYSVSHDLRTPVRAIGGFTEILMREHSEKLDDEARRICSVIVGNTKKMGQLIDELLSFSRLGRSEMRSSTIDMKALANSVYQELTTPETRDRVDFQIGEIGKAIGDIVLIRQVWMNLISNAIKFTAKREKPVIAITGREEGDRIIYCVKDNGAGFDMQYAGKLFGVFQRLHSDKQFEGTGVGLAIVQRVVNRHGGQVWAEGEVDKGGTFCFLLPLR